MKFLRATIALVALVAIAAVSVWAAGQQPPAAQESPWATRAPATPAPGTIQSRVNVIHTSEAALTPAQRAFAEKYLKALQAQDPATMRALVPPATLKCFDKSKQPFLDAWIEKQFRYQIPKDHRTKISTWPPDMSKPSKNATYPVPATNVLEFEYSTPGGSTFTVNQMIGQEAGDWYAIAPCPTEAGMERFAKIEKIRAARRERAERAYAQVHEPLKSQLLALIAKHDNASAWKLCIKSLHVDFMIARAVVAKLAGEKADEASRGIEPRK